MESRYIYNNNINIVLFFIPIRDVIEHSYITIIKKLNVGNSNFELLIMKKKIYDYIFLILRITIFFNWNVTIGQLTYTYDKPYIVLHLQGFLNTNKNLIRPI